MKASFPRPMYFDTILFILALSTIHHLMSIYLNSQICRMSYIQILSCTIEGKISFTTSSSFFDFSIDKLELPRQIHFLLCNTCYWCASDIDVRKPMITQCPSCNSVEIESVPISDKELYQFDYHPDRGITLEFSNL